ncbi:unnamed protein product, partial [Phaeothamnion confervicola]
PDPSLIRYNKTAPYIRALAVVNVASGCAYLWWRVTSSMDGAEYPIWSWIFFGGECILMFGVFISHFLRIFPAEREYVTMDLMVAADEEVGAQATVAVLLPTAGEKMRALEQGILGAYSQRLWPSALPAARQLRVCVLDEKRRPEVLALVDVVYQLAAALSEPAVQRELASKLDEAWVSPKIWMDTFAQFGALDRYIFGRECAHVFELSTALEELVASGGAGGHFRHRLQRASSESHKPGELAGGNVPAPVAGNGIAAAAVAVAAAAGGGSGKGPEMSLEPGCKRLFSDCRRIPSIVYYARKDSGMPRASPKAGNMNSAVFAAEPGMEPVIGGARIIMVNDARHRLKGECLQRTVPYFFRLRAMARPRPGSICPTSTMTAAGVDASTAATVAAGHPPSGRTSSSGRPASSGRAASIGGRPERGGDPAAAAAAGMAGGTVRPTWRYEWSDVAYVQLPQRFEDLGDGDPLANHATLTYFVGNVAKDGVGGATSCGQGGLWRVDALWGYSVELKRSLPDPVVNRHLIGHKCGFRAEVLIEDTHTSLSLFRLGWRSAYVCEPDEALAICVDPPDTVEWRVKQVFRWHLGAVQLLCKEGLAFVLAWRMPTPIHRVIALDCVTYFFQVRVAAAFWGCSSAFCRCLVVGSGKCRLLGQMHGCLKTMQEMFSRAFQGMLGWQGIPGVELSHLNCRLLALRLLLPILPLLPPPTLTAVTPTFPILPSVPFFLLP